MTQTVAFRYEGRSYTVQVERTGNELVIEHDGQCYQVTLTAAGMRANAQVAASAAAPVTLPPTASAGAAVAPAPAPAAAPAASAALAASAPAPGAVVAPMTGTMREVRTEVGAQVTEGQVLFIMEAMKMDIEVPVAGAGSVAAIAVQAGDSITEGQVLARIGG